MTWNNAWIGAAESQPIPLELTEPPEGDALSEYIEEVLTENGEAS